MENLAELVAGHQESLFAFLYRMCGDADLAEDLMQETFVRAMQASRTYRPTARLSTWLFSIASNLMRDHWRRQARRGVAASFDDLSLAAPDRTEEAALRALGRQGVRAALLQLPPQQRAALVLRYYHDLSYEEIAQALACPVGTVRSRIHNGLQRLDELLVREGDGDEVG